MLESKDLRKNKYMLSKVEFDNIRGFFQYWKNQPEYETLKKCKNFMKTRSYFIEWTFNFLKQFYPNVKYKILDYKASVKLENEKNGYKPLDPETEKDTIAFKFQEGRPELYLLIQEDPIILDEARFDAYDRGPFARPKWED